ncbi:MAG: hypothetical protein H7Y36_01370 [Armatimonadetes bacterium]|nr:hypothetical protein [Akkermansiaceae bacterium]
MKKKKYSIIAPASLVAAVMVANTAFAGPEETAPAAPITPPTEDVISGVLNLDFNTHFISYGNDVWGDGSSMSDPTFNPSLEIALQLPGGFTASLGTWWDVNSKQDSPIGGRIQEVDVYAGLAYTFGDFTVKTTYQAWMYGSATEEILDVSLSYAGFLSPSLTIHNRIEAGGAAGSFTAGGVFDPGDEGTVLVAAISHSIEAGPITISFPLNLAYFIDDEFHAVGADNGIGYGSVGVTATLPLSAISEIYGKWNLHGGLTYFITDDEVIPNNPQSDFLTANLGLTVAF